MAKVQNGEEVLPE